MITVIFLRLSRVLHIRSIFKFSRKIREILRNPKERRPSLSSAGVHKIFCSCGKVSIHRWNWENNQCVHEGTSTRCQIEICHTISRTQHSEHQILFGKTTNYNGIISSKEVQGNSRNTETNNLNRDMHDAIT